MPGKDSFHLSDKQISSNILEWSRWDRMINHGLLLCNQLVLLADRASSDKCLDIRVNSSGSTLFGFLHPEVSKVELLQCLLPLVVSRSDYP